MIPKEENRRDVMVIMPAFNESSVIPSVIEHIQKEGWNTIIVIDDASSDDTSAVAAKAGATVVRHAINRGKGAALRTGFEIARKAKVSIVVTMDADGQHEPREIESLIKPISEGVCDVTLGTRPFTLSNMGLSKVIANVSANVITRIVSGLWVRDSQSGFRAYSEKALERINTRFDHYEYESEIIGELARHHLRFREIPITTRYTAYSTKKIQRQTFTRGLKTAAKLFLYN